MSPWPTEVAPALPRTASPWWARSRARLAAPLTVYLDPKGVWTIDAADALPELRHWREAHPQQRLRVVIGAQALRTLIAPADLPLADEAALRDYGRIQLSHYFGAAAQHWPLATWWLDEQRGVCALADDALAAELPQLSSLVPAWALALHHEAQADPDWARAEHTALAVVEGQALSWLVLNRGRLTEVQQRFLDPDAGEAELQALLLGLQQQAGSFSHAPRRLGWSALALPGLARHPGEAAWWSAPATAKGWPLPDFRPRPRATPPLIWAWLLAAGLACGLAGQEALAQRDEAQRLAEQSSVLARLAKPTPAPARPTTATALGTPARQRAAAVARQLDIDWPGRWTEIEQALPAGIQLQSLDLDARSLRLQGSAQDPDRVMQLVDRLADGARQAGPGDASQEVALTRLQKPEAGQDASAGLRFEIVRQPASTGARP